MLKEGSIGVCQYSVGTSLNPYFNGTCSKSFAEAVIKHYEVLVLILILMEHAQREKMNVTSKVITAKS